ncbi:hypothetical protein [Xanthomonas arboricola]|uniref:hypothetical protein n=1 Tax=Xanthomonas arboricola TaxID=56448 RepID=UPI000CEE0BBE|nr:hypothetical protein [Xanthomonas arboricola]PPU42682.1 hypothetical protein XaplCFBP3123_01320 [Xanthomonas arboricola pv. populi]
MNWNNPVIGEKFEREEWHVLRVGPGDSEVLARIRRNGASEADVSLKVAGSPVIPPAVTLPIAQAFEVAAEFAFSSSE